MSDPQVDPAGNTQQFKAFAREQETASAQEPPSRLPIWIAVGVALLVVIAVVAYLAIG
jgi:cytochrome c-type biogenesis protein CcmH/NrfG